MPITFPVRYVSFHDDIGLNFQMNRWMTWIGDRAADDLHRVASRVMNYDDWKREMLTLADEKVRTGALLDAAYYVRAAEFFMMPGDPDQQHAYDRFLVPLRQLHQQMEAARVFMPAEQAQNDCQIGNVGLAVRVILGGLGLRLPARRRKRDPARCNIRAGRSV